MITIQVYTCPVHGARQVTCTDEVPDEVPCATEYEEDGNPCSCCLRASWTPSAPSVRTHDTTLRALIGHTRDTNPWK